MSSQSTMAGATHALLAESFRQLALQRPIEKITIREITDLAGVIRPTFYNHFQDKYELLEWIVRTDLVDPVLPLLDAGMLREALTLSLSVVKKNEDFYRRAARVTGQNSFHDILKGILMQTAIMRIDMEKVKVFFPMGWLTPEMTADYFAEEMTAMLIRWIDGDMEVPVEDVVETIIFCCTHSMYEIIQSVVK